MSSPDLNPADSSGNLRVSGIFQGCETFSTEEDGLMLYSDYMPNIDDDTVIIKDNSHKSIDNFSIKALPQGFELWLLHSVKVSGNHVDEAELVGTWRFESLKHLADIREKITVSIKRRS